MSGRVALVTGAGRGIGAAIARALADAGHTVALLDLLESEAEAVARSLRESGGEALAVRCDVGRGDEVDRALAQVRAAYGVPSILVNNAGVGGPFHRADEVDEQEWESILRTNLTSVFLLSRRLLPEMKAQGYGRIVNIASVLGLMGSALSSTYAASKHGMVGYTRALAAEWGPHGITCNAVCPGYVDTSMGVQSGPVSDYHARVLERSPVKRLARPEEVAALVVHLVGAHGGYINGAAYTLDGGLTADLGVL